MLERKCLLWPPNLRSLVPTPCVRTLLTLATVLNISGSLINTTTNISVIKIIRNVTAAVGSESVKPTAEPIHYASGAKQRVSSCRLNWCIMSSRSARAVRMTLTIWKVYVGAVIQDITQSKVITFEVAVNLLQIYDRHTIYSLAGAV